MPTVASFARGAIRRLPVETVLVSTAALATILAIHGDQGVWPLRVVLAAIVAAPLAFALHGPTPKWAPAGGAAISALALILVSLGVDSTGAVERAAFAWTYAPLLLASYLVPFIVAAPRFSTFVRRFFEELTTWGLLAAVANAAVGVLMYALIALFHLDASRLTADAMLLVSAAILLVAVERLLPDRQLQGKVPELWRRLATAIGAPFVCVLLLILTIYEVSVVVRGELPNNVLSPLIIGAGVVGYICALIITAVATERVGTAAIAPADPYPFLRLPAVRIARAFPVALLALLPMAGWALIVRVEQYGLTPFRVARIAAVLCLAGLSIWGSLRWVRRRPPLSWEVPSVIAAVAILLAVGPLSAVTLSTRSLAGHLEAELVSAGVSTRDVASRDPDTVRSMPTEQWTKLADAIETLAEVGGERGLRRVLHGAVDACVGRWSGAYACLRRLGVGTQSDPNVGVAAVAQPVPSYQTAAVQSAIEGAFGELTFVTVTHVGRSNVTGHTIRLRCDDNGWATASLERFADAAVAAAPLPTDPVPLQGQSCASPGQLVIRSVEVRVDTGGDPSVDLTRVEGVWIRPRL
jgi:Domain of unknown function (DUF4153)